MSQLKTTFVPDKRNLGGKRDIDNLQKNHLIALINVKPSLNSHKPPHPHVNKNHYSLKKQLGTPDEFREVYEVQRRLNELKKGGIDNKRPTSATRAGYISKQIPSCKNILEQDHNRNISSLLNRLADVDRNHIKNLNKIQSLPLTGSQMKKSQSNNSMSNTFTNSFFKNNQNSNNRNQQFAMDIYEIESLGARKNSVQKKQNQNEYEDFNEPLDYTEGIQTNLPYYQNNYQQQQEYYQEDEYQEGQEDYEENEQQYLQQIDEQNYENDDYSQKTPNSKLYQNEFNNPKNQFNQQNFDNQIVQNNHQQYLQNNKPNRPSSAKNNNSLNNNSNQNKPFQVPIVAKGTGDPYLEIKRIVMNIVMDYNIFEKSGIKNLIQSAIQQNPTLDKKKLNILGDNIIVNLYGAL